jgi:hypothetical protein
MPDLRMLHAAEDHYVEHGLSYRQMVGVEASMKVDRISFVVNPTSKIEDFIDVDRRLYDSWLRQQPGYLSKQYARYPGGRLDLLVFWRSDEDYKRATSNTKEIDRIEARFRSEMGQTYRRLTK